ncbi:hypothetical protein DJ568_00555 [Mucilaginibacter hurinus]|uniref:Uncharacterized protein n=1 Tax=Mucilaginibacter hurinus TaxID=2201324 RepID=A0A367GTH5_9SPHI|nr:DUF892 family protein [Mucilaginibacter hurinus]RCH56385.1 hypothetical protein DJ568_00555 [Mucilaginibacter hurinus]
MTATNKVLNDELLRQVFIHNLDRLYFGKHYLVTHIDDLVRRASFRSLKLALDEFADDIKLQIKRMDEIYRLLNVSPSDANCNPIKAIVRDNFCLDEPKSLDILTDTDIILYIQILEHLSITACRHLKTIAVSLNFKEADQLLTECFDESVDNDNLFMLINKEYYKS